MWMSLARLFMPSMRIRSASFTTGGSSASLAIVRRSVSSSPSSLSVSDSSVGHVLEELLERLLQTIGVRERVAHLDLGRDDGLDALAGRELHRLEAVEVERIGGDDLDRAVPRS